MWRHALSSTEQRLEVERFLAQLRAFPDFFEADVPVSLARAPGRLDVIGGIADYSGSLVLEMPLAVATLVAVQPVPEPMVTILSTAAEGIGSMPLVTIALHTLCPPGKPLDYTTAHQLLMTDARSSWIAYIAGVLVVLQRERQIEFPHGLRIFVSCDVPIGKGVSSSASLEVATMQALCALANRPLDERALALLCQKVENAVVGAPCGIMDQFSVVSGKPGHLLALRCQPAELQEAVPVPEEIEFWGIDSGIRHAVTGSDYEAVRVGAFMGYRILAEKAGLAVKQLGRGVVEIADPCWGGYLANISPSIWERFYRDEVPLNLRGDDFLALYGGSTDTVTHINPDQLYAVRQPTAHPIYEHQRARLFRALLAKHPLTEEHLLLLGELMYQAHASYSACGLGSDGTDRLVELVSEAGPAQGLYGAKITGGGSGGIVVVLGRRTASTPVQQIAARYEQETRRQVSLLSGTSSGALAWGTVSFRLERDFLLRE
ncbi:MAG TPA: galactokinase family protein [Ktedonobacteraceae bacterium]|jgi:L-arabinokinase|nr:galactokinase family protein [Ktedonobacteraceae bacterium]